MPDSAFKELQWMEIQSASGASLSLKLLAIARIPHSQAACGTYLKLVTISGTIVLDDTAIYYDEAVGSLFNEAGFTLFSNTGQGNNQGNNRRLQFLPGQSSSSSLRQLSPSDFSLVGFFNAIDEVEWVCTTIEKPELPAIFSAEATFFSPCEVQDTDVNSCYFDLDNGMLLQSYGAMTEADDRSYLKSTRLMFVTEDSTEIVDYPPHHPGVRLVTQSLSSGLLRTYQLDANGEVSHCREDENTEIKMTLPDGFIFYHVADVADTNLRNFRISYEVNEETFPNGPVGEWVHIDYYDDATTHLPKLLIDDDGSIIQMENMKVGNDLMDSFSDLGLSVNESSFKSCLKVTAVWEANGFDDMVNKTSSGEIPEFSTPAEALKYQNLLNSWNWSLPYPPSGQTGVNGFTEDDFDYYIDQVFDGEGEEDDDDDLILPTNPVGMDGNFSTWREWALNALALIENDGDYGIQANTSSRRLMEGPAGAVYMDNVIALSDGGAGGRRRLFDVDIEVDFTGPAITFILEMKKFDVYFFYGKDGGSLFIGGGGKRCAYEVICVSGEVDVSFGGTPYPVPSQKISLDFDLKAALESVNKKFANFVSRVLGGGGKSMSYNIAKITYKYYHYQKDGKTRNYEKHLIGARFRVPLGHPLVRGSMTTRFEQMKKSKKKGRKSKYDKGSIDVRASVECYEFWKVFFGKWKTIYSKKLFSDEWYTR